MIFPEYKKLVKQSESFSLEERVKATDELQKFKDEDPKQAWYYSKWLQDEQQGKDPLTSKAVQKAQEPTEAVKPVRVSKPTRKATKASSKPAMSYEQFLKEFNALGKSHLFRADGKSPMVRLSELSREHPETYAAYRDRMREEDD